MEPQAPNPAPVAPPAPPTAPEPAPQPMGPPPNGLPLPPGIGIRLDPGEVVTRVIHQTILALLPVVLVALVLEAFSLGLGYLTGHFPQYVPFPTTMVLALIGITTLLAALILLIGVYVYNRNVLVFTNKHLIIGVQFSLFDRRVSQVSFLRVQDVTGQKVGIAQTIFNYGDVEVQSAGEQEKFIFRYAPDPEALADDALQVHESCVREAAKQGIPEPTE